MNILIASLPFLGLLTVGIYGAWAVGFYIGRLREESRWHRRCERVRLKMQIEDKLEERLEQFDLQEFISR